MIYFFEAILYAAEFLFLLLWKPVFIIAVIFITIKLIKKLSNLLKELKSDKSSQK